MVWFDILPTELDLVSDFNDGLVQDYINSSTLAMELLQSCAKPSIFIPRYVLENYGVLRW